MSDLQLQGNLLTHDGHVIFDEECCFLAALLEDAHCLCVGCTMQTDTVDAQQPVPRFDCAFPVRKRRKKNTAEIRIEENSRSFKRSWLFKMPVKGEQESMVP